jgi:hypothetical protein
VGRFLSEPKSLTRTTTVVHQPALDKAVGGGRSRGSCQWVIVVVKVVVVPGAGGGRCGVWTGSSAAQRGQRCSRCGFWLNK